MMNEYQRPKQIHIIDLLLYCLEKWRWIIACMLIAAVVTGAYTYRATVKENQAKQNAASAAEEAKAAESTEPVNEDVQEERPVGTYEQAIEEIERDLEIQEEYLENSVVMQLEPYHISTGTLSYYMEGGEHAGSLISAYNIFVSSGKMAEELYADNVDISVEDLRYLVTFVNVGNSSEPQNPVFQIIIRMPDSSSSEFYLKRAEEIMTEYVSLMQTQVGAHKITLLDSVQSEMADLDIQKYQSSVRTAYMASVRNLKALRTEAQANPDVQNTSSGNDTAAAVILENPLSAAVHSAVYGLVLGACLPLVLLAVWYLFGSRLQATEGFGRDYGMPVLGIVRISGTIAKKFDFVDAGIFRLRGGSYGKVSIEEQIKIASNNIQAAILKNTSGKEIKKIMIAGTLAEKDMEVLCSRLAAEMPGVSASSYKQLIFQSAALQELADYDGVVFLEKRGISNNGLIMQERKSVLDRNVEVLGTIVVC